MLERSIRAVRRRLITQDPVEYFLGQPRLRRRRSHTLFGLGWLWS